jgi:translation elongation factor EF-4
LREPFVRLEIITTTGTIGGIMQLSESRRCKLIEKEGKKRMKNISSGSD